MSARHRWMPHLALLAYGVGAFIYRDAIMDDTFIHLQYARNLRLTGELAFNHGQPSLGSTSPLWIFMLAAFSARLEAARLLSLACGALSVLAFGAIARRTLRGSFPAAATIAFAGSLWLVRHAYNGMESTAGTLFVLLAVLLRLEDERRTWRDVAFGAALSAAALIRPEALLLAAIYAVLDLASDRGRSRFAAWMPACVLPLVAWVAFAHARTGHILPGSGAAKSGGLGLDPVVWLRVVGREIRMLLAAQAVELAGIALALLLALRLDGRGALRRLAAHPLASGSAMTRALMPYAVFSGALLLAYAVFDVQVQPRYLLIVTPCVVWLGFAAWQALLGGGVIAAAGVCAASLALGAIVGARIVYPATRDFASGFWLALRPMAMEVARHGGSGTTVATPDIGVMGFLSGARVLDLGGIIDPRVQRLSARVGYDQMLEQGLFLDFGPVDYVVDRSPERERFAGHVTRGLRWRPITTAAVHGLGISRPQVYYYTLYVLDPEHAYGATRSIPEFSNRLRSLFCRSPAFQSALDALNTAGRSELVDAASSHARAGIELAPWASSVHSVPLKEIQNVEPRKDIDAASSLLSQSFRTGSGACSAGALRPKARSTL